MCVYVCVCVCVCVHIYTYICMHVYICIYIVSNRISSIPPALQQRFADAGLGLQDKSKDKDDIESARSGIASVFDQYTAFFNGSWHSVYLCIYIYIYIFIYKHNFWPWVLLLNFSVLLLKLLPVFNLVKAGQLASISNTIFEQCGESRWGKSVSLLLLVCIKCCIMSLPYHRPWPSVVKPYMCVYVPWPILSWAIALVLIQPNCHF